MFSISPIRTLAPYSANLEAMGPRRGLTIMTFPLCMRPVTIFKMIWFAPEKSKFWTHITSDPLRGIVTKLGQLQTFSPQTKRQKCC